MTDLPDELRGRLRDPERIRDGVELADDITTSPETPPSRDNVGGRVVDHKADDFVGRVVDHKADDFVGRVVDHKADDFVGRVVDHKADDFVGRVVDHKADDFVGRVVDHKADDFVGDPIGDALAPLDGRDQFQALPELDASIDAASQLGIDDTEPDLGDGI